jgi:hypothetical protein
MAAAIGFAIGVGYVANKNVQFDQGSAAIARSKKTQLLAEQKSAGTNIGASNATENRTPLDRDTSREMGISNPDVFKIVAPIRNQQVKTNPVVRIDFNFPDSVKYSNLSLTFSFAAASRSGVALGTFKPINNFSQYKSIFKENRATYVLPNFTYLPPGFYIIRASLSGPSGVQNYYSDTIIQKVGQVVSTAGVCACETIKFEDEGANGMMHRFKIIATLKNNSNADNCGEQQNIKATATFSNDTESVNVYATNAGVNAFMTQQQIDEANRNGANIVAMPYEGGGHSDDDYKSTTDTDGDPEGRTPDKMHGKDIVIWQDEPGIQEMPKDAKNATFNAELVHIVNPGCFCKTQINIEVKNGVVTKNDAESSCE